MNSLEQCHPQWRLGHQEWSFCVDCSTYSLASMGDIPQPMSRKGNALNLPPSIPRVQILLVESMQESSLWAGSSSPIPLRHVHFTPSLLLYCGLDLLVNSLKVSPSSLCAATTFVLLFVLILDTGNRYQHEWRTQGQGLHNLVGGHRVLLAYTCRRWRFRSFADDLLQGIAGRKCFLSLDSIWLTITNLLVDVL